MSTLFGDASVLITSGQAAMNAGWKTRGASGQGSMQWHWGNPGGTDGSQFYGADYKALGSNDTLQNCTKRRHTENYQRKTDG